MSDLPNGAELPHGHSGHRERLPVPQSAKNDVKFWTYLKQCIGKELSKITMPVQWNEPLSLLQRLSEYMNYAYLLGTAAQVDQLETRMSFVATFAVSALASNFERMGKPFNPLLGETYELELQEFRFFTEQVCHHPPVSAFHAEHPEGLFKFHGSMSPKTKFWGKSIEFMPKGVCTVELPQRDEVYTWNNVHCVINNILLGTLWMEQVGTMELVNQTTKHKLVLSFKAGGWFAGGDDLHVVEGFLINEKKEKLRFFYGRWTSYFCSVDIASLEAHLGASVDKVKPDASNMPKHAPLGMCDIPNSKALWQVEPRPEDSTQYYNFSQFTMGLNELAPDAEKSLCRSDSRLRPDIRALEIGELDQASTEKERLEEKQREFRKQYKNKKESDWWSPRWFEPAKHPQTDEDTWAFKGGYWEGKDRDQMHEDDDDHHVHFDEGGDPHNDNQIRVQYQSSPDKGMTIVASLGFLQIFHRYEIILTLAKDKIPDTGNLIQKETEPPNLHCRVFNIEDDGGHDARIFLQFLARKDKICSETIYLTDGHSEVQLKVQAKVLGKGKGTGALRNGIKCIAIIQDPNESENDTDWKGF
eukprot:snap_masked-scaffold801_size95070-processed-gene-0.4 protein:Tk01648 transcript:snap_masked-scaffold801_size95070-processed-gene-0.4-mRNA-1 annotation:"oxysterol-binding protein 2"